MFRILSAALAVTVVATCVSGEPPEGPETEANARLLQRIDELEKRIVRLESALEDRDAKKAAPPKFGNPRAPQTHTLPEGYAPPHGYAPGPPAYRPTPPSGNYSAPPSGNHPAPPSGAYPVPRLDSRPPHDEGFVPPPSLSPQRVPKRDAPSPRNWQRFEFNGQSFYIIPVDEAPRPTRVDR